MIPGELPFIKLMNERQELAGSIGYLYDWNVGDSGLAAFRGLKPIAAIPKVLARTAMRPKAVIISAAWPNQNQTNDQQG